MANLDAVLSGYGFTKDYQIRLIATSRKFAQTRSQKWAIRGHKKSARRDAWRFWE